MKEVEYGPLTLRGDDTLTIIDCEKDATRILIPAAVDGRPVVGIGDRAFENCLMLEEVDFHEDLWLLDERFEIGGNAFLSCISLREIELPRTVSVGHGAFLECRALVRVVLPPGGCYVAPYGFARCSSLREITPLNLISEGVFSECTSLPYLPITEWVDEIEEDAFEHCDSLVEITIPHHVTRIEALAFRGCYNLKRVTFERPGGWYETNRYAIYEGKRFPLDLDDPAKNAHDLAYMDFDDGVRAWEKTTKRRL